MRKLTHLVAIGALALLVACAATLPRSLWQIESGYDATVLNGIATYSQLPKCTGVAGQVCHKPDVLAKLVQGDQAAQIVFVQAETVILGCDKATWIKSQATPPTATCGTPASDQSAINTALSAAQSAVTAAVQLFTLYGVMIGS